MRESFILQDTKTNVVINQTEVEVMNAVVASGATLDEDSLTQLGEFIAGIIHDNEKMYINNEIVLL